MSEQARFQKRPVEIEAIRLETDEDFTNAAEWIGVPVRYDDSVDEVCLDIITLEGTMTAHFGDWIIRGVKGEFYPCKPDIFRASYQPLDEDDDPMDWCEVCNRPAEYHDSEGVPLCEEDFESLMDSR